MTNILVVEDDKSYQGVLKKRLEFEGYRIHQAYNGLEALKLIKKKSIDLILLDLIMPEMDGITFYYKLRNELNKRTPVIVITNFGEEGNQTGIQEVLIKSDVSLDELIGVIRKYTG